MKIDETTIAAVTGGASGLGAATATALAERGAKVAILDMNKDLGTALAADLGGHFNAVDVTDPAQVGTALKNIRDRHGALHVLVNCAGIGTPAKTVAKGVPHDQALFAKVIGVNLLGSFNCASQAAALMVSADPVSYTHLTLPTIYSV